MHLFNLERRTASYGCFALTHPFKYSRNPNAREKINHFEVPGNGRCERRGYSWTVWVALVHLLAIWAWEGQSAVPRLPSPFIECVGFAGSAGREEWCFRLQLLPMGGRMEEPST